MNKYLLIFIFLFSLYCISSCNGDKDNSTATANDTQAAQGIPAPQPITYTIDSVYPHDPKAFTQGLELYNGKLYEGTGLPDESNVRIVDLKSGKILNNHHIADTSIFGEGITIFKNKLYQLTWTSHKVFVYDINNIDKPVNTFKWNSEGWGLTHDSSELIVSDGITSNIYFVSPDDFHTLKTISVTDNNGPVLKINELEYINGFIFANQWETDNILKIDPSNGHVVGIMNMAGLLQQYAAKEITDDTNVLNGIAYDSSTKKMYITGKKWPKLFVLHLNN